MAVPKTWTTNEVLTAADLNAALASTAWTAPTFLNSWVNFGAPYQVAQYRKVGDIVQVRGLIKSGTVTSAAFTLPSGFRPPDGLQFSTVSQSLFGMIIVEAGGNFLPQVGNNASFSICCMFSVTT